MLLLTLGGCGVGEYEKRMEGKEAEMKYLEPFLAVPKKRTTIPDTTTSLRLPDLLSRTPYTTKLIDPDMGGGTMLSPERLQPPFVTLPGIRVCYETMVSFPVPNGQPRQLAYNLHVAVDEPKPAEPAAEGDAAKPEADGKTANPSDPEAMPPTLADELKAQLAAAIDEKTLKGQSLEWETFEARTPDTQTKTTLPWKRIRLKIPQQFGLTKQTHQPEPLMGSYQLYLYDAGDRRVMLVWRVPDELEVSKELDAWAEAAAGTLKVQ